MKLSFALIAANVAVFGLQVLFPGFTDAFALTPALAVDGAWWQFLTYMFLHDPFTPLHIMINMFVLGMFGPPVEHQLGPARFIALYLLAGLGSAFLHLALAGDPLVMMLGASGAVFGILAAYGILFPKNWIMVFFIPLPAPVAVVAITAFELFAGIFNLLPGIANFGHLGGIITGVAFMLIWRAFRKLPPLEDREPRNYEFVWE